MTEIQAAIVHRKSIRRLLVRQLDWAKSRGAACLAQKWIERIDREIAVLQAVNAELVEVSK